MIERDHRGYQRRAQWTAPNNRFRPTAGPDETRPGRSPSRPARPAPTAAARARPREMVPAQLGQTRGRWRRQRSRRTVLHQHGHQVGGHDHPGQGVARAPSPRRGVGGEVARVDCRPPRPRTRGPGTQRTGRTTHRVAARRSSHARLPEPAGLARRGRVTGAPAATWRSADGAASAGGSSRPLSRTDGPRPSDCGVLESGDGWCRPSSSGAELGHQRRLPPHGVCSSATSVLVVSSSPATGRAVLQRRADHPQRVDDAHLDHVAEAALRARRTRRPDAHLASSG